MSGKAYTMREMKAIIEYLVEHRAYSEIRGRKMWIDFANSKTLNRTWQSLKETFLKRILPDIHNPYYKLSLIQIASFRQGSDVESKLNNKLDVEPVDKDIVTNENGQLKINDVEENVGDDKKGEEEDQAPGEAPRNSKLVGDRTSTDTLVLENCYETAEDIQKELEHSDKEEKEKEPSTTQNDSIKVVQDVINDFTSDNDNVDEIKQTKKDKLDLNEQGKRNDIPIEISDSEVTVPDPKSDEQGSDKSPPSLKIVEDSNDKSPLPLKTVDDSNDKSPSEKEKPDGNPKNTSNSILSGNNEVKCESKPENKEKVAEQKVGSGRNSTGTQNITNTTADTQLPNNPEGLDKICSKVVTTANKEKVQKLSLNNKKQNKKRATSQEAPKVKRKKIEHQMSISDTDAITNVTKKEEIKQINSNGRNSEKEDQIISNDAQVLNLDTIPDSQKAKSDEKKTSKGEINKESSDIGKSCVKNVSLYAKQLSYTIYSDSGNSIDQTDTSKQQARTSNNPEAQTSKTGQVLSSNSDSSVHEVQRKNKSVLRIMEKKQRDNALAHALGFTNDVISGRKRHRSYNRKRSSSRHKTLYISSGTSEFTSDPESEFISPPRGRKNRGTRKYLKPKSARILSLEEEGGLFVMHGKKIYPIVRDGKILKNYLTYTPDDESEQEESYWKLKYVEEKKKADDLAKLLKQTTGSKKSIEDITTARKDSKDQETTNKTEEGVADTRPVATTSGSKVPDDQQGKTVKIKFTTNNEEVQLEGHWTHINPVLEHVVGMFNRNKKTEEGTVKPASTSGLVQQRLPTPEIVVSGVSTPVVTNDNETNRVNEIESEIFKEIEELDKAESGQASVKQTEDVAKRRGGRARKPPAEKPAVSLKKSKVSIESEKQADSKTANAPLTGITTRRSGRALKKVLNETTEKNATYIVNKRKSSPRKAKNIDQNIPDVDDGIKYKFSSPPASVTQRKPRNKRQPVPRSSYALTARINSPPDNISLISEETTQGYVDSDCSPVVYLKKKRRSSLNTRNLPNRFRKKSVPCLNDDIMSESSNSYVTAPLKSRTFTNSSVSSHIYRSESYQLLMPNNNNSPKRLEKIDESLNDGQFLQLKPIRGRAENNNDKTSINLNDNIENESSSMSLPTSPVLSIVENISLNKTLLSSIDEHALGILDDSHAKITLNELMSPDLADASMPLMGRNYTVEKKCEDGIEYHYSINQQNPSVSDSFLTKICTVKIEDITLSDSINVKFRNLLIESAKKFGKKMETSKEDEVVKTVSDNVEPQETVKEVRAKKRSSTPRKRKTVRKSTVTKFGAFVEEEHTQSCSHAGRKSCPPLINIVDDDKKEVQPTEDKPNTTNVIKKKERKKKDIIKVKITRPTKRKTNVGCVETLQDNDNEPNKSATNDAESGIFLGLNDSVDLIHNHSETCLQAHECILNNSLEIVENSKSIVSIDSSCFHSEKECSASIAVDEKIALELLCSNAQDGCDVFKDLDPYKSEINENINAAVSLQNVPVAGTSPNSLITEDLSVESSPQTSKWYFFSDEETNTNCVELAELAASDVGYGSNLHQIFPITCAVPDLSTITEMSKEADENTNSKKNIIQDSIKDEIYSQSLFSNQ